MAFVPGFKYDIFISYSHIDNDAPEGKPGWIDHFHDELESWLVRRFGRGKIEIWRDKELKGSTLFDNRIKDVIENSALFFALVSPHYLDSDYCQKEIDWFCSRAKESPFGLSVKDESRLFNILLNNIHHTSWPEELSGTSGFPMHDAPGNSTKHGYPIDPRELQFKKKLRYIIDAVDIALRAFPQVSPEHSGREQEGDGVSVFIADVPDTLQYTRERLIADLKDENVHILYEIPPPMKHDAHEAEAAEAINRAHLAVHLLDELPGRKITGLKSAAYPRKQVEIGMRTDTPQLIWVPKDLQYDNIEDRDYQTFLQSLETDTRSGKDYEFIRGRKTGLSDLILDKIVQLQRESRDRGDYSPILLDTHQKDQRFAFKLANYLSDKGLDIEFNQESINPVASRDNFEAYLKHARSLVIIFGRVAPAWVLGHLKKTIKLVSTQLIASNKTTLENRWIYLLPSCNITGDIDNLVKTFQMNYLDNRDSDRLDERVVEPLLASCKARGRT